jgi:cobalt-zinc-cadmium efflux system membrane fusion protein
MKRGRIALAVLGVIVIITIVWAHEGHKAISTKGVLMGPVTGNLLMEPQARKAVGLATAKVDFGTVEETTQVPSRVVLPWDRHGYASARLQGVVESIRVKPGDAVKAGQVLAEISSLEADTLQLEYIHSLLEKKLIEQNLARARELGERIVAGRELLESETDLKDKTGAGTVLRRRLEAVGLASADLLALETSGTLVKRLPILAPIGGFVVHEDLMLGSPVDPMKHVVEIEDPSTVWVKGEVPEGRAATLKPGLPVRIKSAAYPGRVWKATIDRVGSAVSEDTRTIPVWATVENADLALKPGLFALMTIVLGLSENVAVAPLRAIIEDGAERYALVVTKASTYVRVDPKEKVEEYSAEKKEGYVQVGAFAKKSVVVGRSDGSAVEILEGLYPGDEVVAESSHELSALFAQGTLKLTDEAKKNIALASEEVDLRSVDSVVRLSAQLRPPVGATAFAASRIEGKVLALLVAPGQTVEAGTRLAELHSLEVENLQLEYYRASLRERLYRTAVEQLKSLGEVTPRREFLRTETNYRREAATALSLRRRLLALGIDEKALGRVAETGEVAKSLPIFAPIAGRVVDVDVAVGQVIKPEDHLFKILDSRTLWAEARVFEGDFGSVLAGEREKEVLLRAGGRELKAKISFAAQSLGILEKVLSVYAEVKNEDGTLLPGMLGELMVVVGWPEKKVIAAPRRALLSFGAQTVAFVAEGNSWKRVALELGRQGSEYVEVTKGLFPGDKVAVSGVNDLNTSFNNLR